MATFGKVLLFLNVLLAIIMLTLFGLNVGQEKRWAVAVLVHELHPTGLPMDADELDPQDPATKRVDRLTPPVMKGFFDGLSDNSALGGGPVKTVLEELQRVHGKAFGEITSASNDTEKRKLLATYLVPQAKTMIERETLIRRINDPKEEVKNLIAELDRRFTEAKTPPARSSAEQSRQEQRLNIATLLFNMLIDGNWRQRLMRIVGMETYVQAVERQAGYVYNMAREYRALIVRDQTGFEKSYADLVEVIIKESEELYHLDSYLRNLNATLAERQQQIALRTTEVEKATTALDVTTKNAQTELKKLNDVQYDLFQLQQRVGIAIQKNHELEVELRNLEAKKPGL